MKRRALVLAALVACTGCAYYNAMWSAERFAKQARHAEAKGQVAEARGLWGRAAVKAESVVARHPRSKWTDDAMVLRAEALVRAGGCSQAAAPLERVNALSLDDDLRERTNLAAAECALVTGRPGDASGLLAPILASHDQERRMRAAYLAGRAAWEQGDKTAAARLLAQSTHPAAAPARVRVLLASGATPAALALLDSLDSRRFDEAEWTALLDSTAAAAGPAAASVALDHLLERGRVPGDAAARLLLADGDRRATAEPAVATARYAAAAAAAPDPASGDVARIRRLRTLTTTADSLADLSPLRDALGRSRAVDYRGLVAALNQIHQRETDVEAFRSAELVRDSLHAPRLAGNLFVDVATRWPASVFAPKAIVAAMALSDARADSLRSVLDATYPSSPYALALRGEAAPAFPAAEDSLARALGVQLAAEPRGNLMRVLPPVPGPRSVWLDPPATAISRQPAPAARKPVTPTRPQNRPGERPVDRP